ncbi:hypothetical protein TanjilG_19284 [Lupinus angustifolius]|uniref:PRC-barrel domain-containing protein n=1 Tax=Lupinus angustifolius TaxID=3871 RepID=A0A1J7I3Q3_LUPAN|nr:PREDICTED: uncharacterized protein LOC109352691 [Lupinus angustifolius]OIW07443.1 hypothetical protein TanjilG_19284 [Lupinus angustifolius]
MSSSTSLFSSPNSHYFNKPFSPKLSPFKPLSASLNGGGRRRRDYYNDTLYNQLQFDDTKFQTSGLDNKNSHAHEDGSLNGRRTSNTILFNDTKFQTLGLETNGSDEMIEGRRRRRRSREGEDLIRIQQKGDDDDDGVELEKDEKSKGKVVGIRKVKQIIRRSNLLAKQVISIRSALSLGFVSQLWVDTTSWMVLFAEVRPNLLSGDSEKFLLEDIKQVGDVILVQDESVTENEFKMIGLETLVGYKVVTPSQRNIGKVRGYTFSINSGAVEELELDSFGLSIIPSTLVSTYSLVVEDVLEVVSDAVVVSEAAASRIQRLSKGFLGNQNVGTSMDDFEDYDYEEAMISDNVSRRRNGSFGRKKQNERDWDNEDNWELPMDYL